MKDFGRSEWATAATLIVGFFIAFGLPQVFGTFGILQATLYAIFALFTLSLAYIWGYGGIMCFGQSAFFGVGAYTFVVAAINLGDSTMALLLAAGIGALFAAILGYFMFYGRLSDVYMGIVTLLTTLICSEVMSQTAGQQFAIGKVLLGGFNGIPNVPPINIPGQPNSFLDTSQMFRLVACTVIAFYAALKLLNRSSFGRITVAIRENEARAGLLGYNVRLCKVFVFALGGGAAGLAGAFYASNQLFIDPNVFSLAVAVQCIIWVMLGGLGTLVGPIIACCVLQYLTTALSNAAIANNSFILGLVLIAVVVLVPSGLLPALSALIGRISVGNVKNADTGRRSLSDVSVTTSAIDKK